MPQVTLSELLERSADDVLILDGGTGSSLEDRGLDVRGELWSSAALLEEAGRALTRELHADFLDAGADIFIANTHNLGPNACHRFLAGPEGDAVSLPADVLRRPEDERAEALLAWLERAGVALAQEAVPAERDVVVAAGIGSEEPWARRTARTQAEIEAALEPCARALAATPGTLILFETLSTPPEVAAVAALARKLELSAFGIGLSCSPEGTTWGGVGMSEVAQAFAATDIAAMFVQCTRFDVAGTGLTQLVEALDTSSSKAVPGVYANDGRTWRDHRWHGERISPQAYADVAETWRAAGARILGGCCGTSPAHVAELRRRWPVAPAD